MSREERMISALLHPVAIFAQLRRTLDLALRKGTVDTLFLTNSAGLWQALIVNWGLGACLGLLGFLQLFPEALSGMTHDWARYGLSILLSIVSNVTYVLLVFSILQRLGREAVLLRFVVPYLWLNTLQGAIFGGMLIGASIMGTPVVLILYLPLAFWLIYWQVRVARDVIGLGTLAGVGFWALQALVNLLLFFAGGFGLLPAPA